MSAPVMVQMPDARSGVSSQPSPPRPLVDPRAQLPLSACSAANRRTLLIRCSTLLERSHELCDLANTTLESDNDHSIMLSLLCVLLDCLLRFSERGPEKVAQPLLHLIRVLLNVGASVVAGLCDLTLTLDHHSAVEVMTNAYV